MGRTRWANCTHFSKETLVFLLPCLPRPLGSEWSWGVRMPQQLCFSKCPTGCSEWFELWWCFQWEREPKRVWWPLWNLPVRFLTVLRKLKILLRLGGKKRGIARALLQWTGGVNLPRAKGCPLLSSDDKESWITFSQLLLAINRWLISTCKLKSIEGISLMTKASWNRGMQAHRLSCILLSPSLQGRKPCSTSSLCFLAKSSNPNLTVYIFFKNDEAMFSYWNGIPPLPASEPSFSFSLKNTHLVSALSLYWSQSFAFAVNFLLQRQTEKSLIY